MFEKVNPSHPDKVADRIAGALVDLAYSTEQKDPRIAVEVLIGHGRCHIIAETSVKLDRQDVLDAVLRIAGEIEVEYVEVPQDAHLALNQQEEIRCGDNGIFRGMPVTEEQRILSKAVRKLYEQFPTDGKYILSGRRFVACQSCASGWDLANFIGNNRLMPGVDYWEINPIGEWTGGTDVDTGATNRKLGSDMADSVTGGGLHGKDLSKADVSVNIYAWMKAQMTRKPVELCCAIGDKEIDGKPYAEIVEMARQFIRDRGGFEAFAEWGLV